MKMNLPNKLTVLRVLLIPFFVAAMLLSVRGGKAADYRASSDALFTVLRYLAFLLFCAASVTDFLDGWIARRDGLVTNFGKFMDPLADKLLVCSAMIALVGMDRIPSWIVIVIIAREFIISGFRLVASDNGVVIAASYWGKFKTTFQMLMVICMVANFQWLWFKYTTTVLMWIALILTIVSLIDYIVHNIQVLKEPE
jgi:CDP-diacylglycerol--glycerol-3-phosphate 3-phosphatidyltransferase